MIHEMRVYRPRADGTLKLKKTVSAKQCRKQYWKLYGEWTARQSIEQSYVRNEMSKGDYIPETDGWTVSL